MITPQIISSYAEGVHTKDLKKTVARLEKEHAYKDLSTIIVIPALESVPVKVVASWLNLYKPPNQKVTHVFALGLEVGWAYSTTIENVILAHPELSKFKYILTMEHDNAPPPDGLVKLLARAEDHPEFDCIGGLYFTKGEGGQPQIWGNPKEDALNFKPCPPDPKGGLVECCGTGMGFNLWRTRMFKDTKLRRPWFKTTADTTNGCMTQDLYFWKDARKHGYRCAVDCSVKVNHYDVARDIMW